ncbi:hypothetical protein IAU59_007583 [Kwoniella sp. CBS 9459]
MVSKYHAGSLRSTAKRGLVKSPLTPSVPSASASSSTATFTSSPRKEANFEPELSLVKGHNGSRAGPSRGTRAGPSASPTTSSRRRHVSAATTTATAMTAANKAATRDVNSDKELELGAAGSIKDGFATYRDPVDMYSESSTIKHDGPPKPKVSRSYRRIENGSETRQLLQGSTISSRLISGSSLTATMGIADGHGSTAERPDTTPADKPSAKRKRKTPRREYSTLPEPGTKDYDNMIQVLDWMLAYDWTNHDISAFQACHKSQIPTVSALMRRYRPALRKVCAGYSSRCRRPKPDIISGTTSRPPSASASDMIASYLSQSDDTESSSDDDRTNNQSEAMRNLDRTGQRSSKPISIKLRVPKSIAEPKTPPQESSAITNMALSEKSESLGDSAGHLSPSVQSDNEVVDSNYLEHSIPVESEPISEPFESEGPDPSSALDSSADMFDPPFAIETPPPVPLDHPLLGPSRSPVSDMRTTIRQGQTLKGDAPAASLPSPVLGDPVSNYRAWLREHGIPLLGERHQAENSTREPAISRPVFGWPTLYAKNDFEVSPEAENELASVPARSAIFFAIDAKESTDTTHITGNRDIPSTPDENSFQVGVVDGDSGYIGRWSPCDLPSHVEAELFFAVEILTSHLETADEGRPQTYWKHKTCRKAPPGDSAVPSWQRALAGFLKGPDTWSTW